MNAKMIWNTVTNWPLVQMNVARTRAGVRLDTLEMDLIVITSMQVRCAENNLKYIVMVLYAQKIPWLSLTKNCQ